MLSHTEYLLTLVSEEALEVAHRAMKALRFGMSETQAGQELTNAQRLLGEVIDLVTTLELLEEEGAGFVIPADTKGERLAKRQKISRYMRYSQQLGSLDPLADINTEPVVR